MKKILIIEDNESMGKILEKTFKDKGFEVAWVRDGEVGLRELEMIHPDIALMDMMLPSLNGYEILEARKKNPVLQNVPIVVISNSGQEVELAKLKDLDVADHVIKTQITPEEVYDKVNNVLLLKNNPEQMKSSELVIDDNHEAFKSKLDGISVLWIEDDMFLASIVSRKLSATGAHFLQAKSGTEAFTMLESELPSVIVLDLVLPGMSGFEILEKIKTGEKTKNIPVIVLSNLDQRDDMEKCFKLGAVKFFVKALVTLDKIFEEVEKLVKK